MKYISTRGDVRTRDFTGVLTDGLAPDGGLYVPAAFLEPEPDFWAGLKGRPYHDVAFAVLRLYVDNAIPDDALKQIVTDVYAPCETGFRNKEITPLIALSENLHILELFHGPTLAFKDVALQLLGRLFDYVLQQRGETITVIGATSGDTGSAAIEGLKHCANARIFILHPHNRTSDVQRRQMTTVTDGNVYNIAIDGSFDDCQAIVKDLFNDMPFRKKQNLSAVNSINWARIIAQSVYYVYAALRFDSPVRFAVPTGNFGNVYAAYVAQRTGLPVERLIIGSNRNDILTRFFKTGIMQTGPVEPSLSPSMDIQVSSNLERYLYELFGRDAGRLKAFMTDFRADGVASVPDSELAKANGVFAAYRCDDDGILKTIRTVYERYDYLCDPHTAVGLSAAMQHGPEDGIPTIALACAHPAKFPDAVAKTVGIRPALPEFLADLFDREERYTVLPADTGAVRDFIGQT